MDFSFQLLSNDDDLSEIKNMRHEIFVSEQGISVEADNDGQDFESYHLLVTSIKPAGVGRITPNGGVVALSRIGTMKNYRGIGLGKEIVRQLEEFSIELGFTKASLQPHAYLEKFYANLGYQTVGGTSKVGGYDLITMTKELNSTR